MTCLSDIISKRLIACYVNPQSAFGTAATDYGAADAIGVDTASGSAAPRYSTPSRKGPGFGEAAIEKIAERFEGTGTLAGPLLPSGSAGSVCNLDALLSNCAFMDADASATTTVSGGGSTTTVVDVSDASGYTAQSSCVEIGGEVCVITAVDTASTPDNITVYPALTTAPADTAAVNAVKSYRPSYTVQSTQVSATTHMITGNGKALVLLVDTIVNEFKLMAEREGEIRFSASIEGASGGEGTFLEIDDTVGTGTTAIPVTESGPGVPPIGAVMQVRSGSETGMVVTASTSGGTFTATRGGSPDSAVSGEFLDFYVPGYTIPDNGIPAVSGDIFIGSTAICDGGFELTLNNEIQKALCRTSTDAYCRVAPGALTADLALTLPVDRASYNGIRSALMNGYDTVAVRMGSAAGKCALIYAQKATVDALPGFDNSGDDMLEINVDVKCRGNTDTERPVVIAIA